MQVIFIPDGSGPSRSFRFSRILAGAVIGAVALGIGAAGGYMGYDRGYDFGYELASGEQELPGEIVDRFAKVSAEKLFDLKAAVQEQREMLHDSRRRLGDHFDSLGQRVGQLQAHVSRLNALGQRLTDMADLDRAEFNFDDPPAVGGPERPVPWAPTQEPELKDTLTVIEKSLEEKESELRILEALLTNRELHEKQYPQGWPTSDGGWISSSFGHRTDPFTGRKAFHEGVDIAARGGSRIRAMAAGVVTFAGDKPGYGLVVEINHGNGYETRYAHAREVVAKTGDRVEKGDVVALVGSTGRSTGSHVHFEVLKNGRAVDPGEHLHSAG